jgi:hypothetical protein
MLTVHKDIFQLHCTRNCKHSPFLNGTELQLVMEIVESAKKTLDYMWKKQLRWGIPITYTKNLLHLKITKINHIKIYIPPMHKTQEGNILIKRMTKLILLYEKTIIV